MTEEMNNTLQSEALEEILKYGMDGVPRAISVIINEAMKIDRSRHLCAKPYERSKDRISYANGYKKRYLNSRSGKLELNIPQVRDGDYYPGILEKGIRSERALRIAIAEMYIQGVSTRDVSKIMRELSGYEVTSMEVSRASKLLDEEFELWRNRKIGKFDYLYLDARYEKVRDNGHVVDLAVVTAIGVNAETRERELIGVSVKLSEAEIHWRGFLQSLQERGLHGVQLIISDAHAGLKSAKKTVFPSVLWQRCQFHLQQNAQSYIPRRDMKKEVASKIRTIFNAPDLEEATRYLNKYVNEYQSKASQLSKWMSANISEGLTVFSFPKEHRIHIRTNNMSEHTNKEIKRRTRKVGIFPNPESCLRLITGVLLEISDGWLLGNKYLPKTQLD